ncbi:MAG: hypothetical protein ABEK00_03350 [Candidatus Nanohaloarchaea archaeon]
MEIESELSEGFDSLSDDEKVKELRELKNDLEEEDENIVKVRMVEELIASYQD